MSIAYVLDTQALDVFNEIRGIRKAVAPTELELKYQDLEQRIHKILIEEVPDITAMQRLERTTRYIRYCKWLRSSANTKMNRNPKICSYNLAGDATLPYMGSHRWRNSAHVYTLMGDEIRTWWAQQLGSDILCLMPDSGPYASNLVTVNARVAGEQLKYTQAKSVACGVDLGVFARVRQRKTFMRFPSDPIGYCPELELATGAALALHRLYQQEDSSGILARAVAKYFARTTICSSDCVTSPYARDLTEHKPNYERNVLDNDPPLPYIGYPGDPENSVVYSAGHIVRVTKFDRCNKRALGSAGLTENQMNKFKKLGLPMDKVHLITN